MLGSKAAWGIDVGRSSLKAVKLEKIKGRLEITDLELVEFEQQDSEEVDREEQVREVLSRLKARKGIKTESVFISIPGHGTFNRSVSLPPVDPKQIPDMVRWEAQQQIPFPIEEVIWDYQKIDDGEEFGELEINLFAVKKEIVNNFLANLQATDIEIAGIQIAPLALYNFVMYDQEPQGAWVVIDMGAEYSDLVIINGSRMWIRNLQIAGNDITKAIQSKFQIPFGEAEKLKVKAGKSKQAQKIFQLMKPILKDLVGEIHRSIGYYKSQQADIRFEKVLVMGNATKLVGFKRFFRDNLPEYKIELLGSLNKIGVSSKVNVNLLNTNLASFSIALGLAIQASGEAANNVVLLPESIRHEREFKKKKPLYIIALIILAVVFGYRWNASTGLSEELKATEVKAKKTLVDVEAIKADYAKVKDWPNLRGTIDGFNKVHPYRQAWLDVLGEILKVVPKENDRFASKDLKKDLDMLWIYHIEMKRDDQQVRVVPPKGARRPRRPKSVTQSSLLVQLGVMIVSRGSVQQDANRINTAVVAGLKKKLKAMAERLGYDWKRMTVEPKIDYRYVDVRDPELYYRDEKPENGNFFLRIVEISFPLNKAKMTKKKN